MKLNEIRALSDDELQAKLDDSRQELFRLRFQFATGQLTDVSRISKARQTIARHLTVQRERELAAPASQEG